jgi:outer membrane protein assembly factor BamB
MPLLVVVGAGLACAAIWYWPSDLPHMYRTLSVLALAMLAVVLLAFWLTLLSPWPRWLRLAPVVLLVAGVGAFAASVSEVHFTGDMWPVVIFRWQATADELLERDRARQAAEVRPPETAERTVARAIRRNPFESYFGHLRQGVVPGVKLRDDWGAAPPRVVWRQRSGGGYAGFAVADGRAVTVEQRRDDEAVVAYDVDTGRELWQHAYLDHFKETQGGPGPRATPVLVPLGPDRSHPTGYRVVSLGANGHLACLDLDKGDLVWSANVLEKNANLTWGMSGSPLVLDSRRVIVTPGAQTATAKGRGVIAYDLESGKEVWASGTRRGSYSSPAEATLGGLRQLLVFDGEGLTGYRADDGQELWHYPWVTLPPQYINAAQPLVLDGDRVFISSGYNVGCAMLRLKEAGGRWEVETLWENKTNTALHCKFTSPVHRDGFLYGLDEGILACLDARDGNRRWKDGRYGHGQLLLADRHLVILSEKGDLVLVEATPDAHRELGKVHVLDGDKTWNPPALAGNYAFVRNHLWMACCELSLREGLEPAPGTPSD